MWPSVLAVHSKREGLVSVLMRMPVAGISLTAEIHFPENAWLHN
jgi:hypothetical protein